MRHNPEQAKIKECPIRAHSHYRLVVKEVCRPLEDFKDDAKLLLVMYCALRAHKQAYTLAGIIHRDISAGNILIYPDANGESCGVLKDWDLLKQMANVKPGGRQLDRTGTWQFLSVAALDNSSKKIILQDDLESVFHVSLYTAIQFLPHNCPDDRVGAFLYRYFDDYADVAMGEMRCGPLKRTSVTSGKIPLVTILRERVKVDLIFLMPSSSSSPRTAHAINALIATALSWLRAYNHISTAPLPNVRKPSNPAPVRLRSFMQEDLDTRRRLSADKPAETGPTHQPATPDDASETAFAEKLADHEAMLGLFLDRFVLCE
ncbi:hypothetical protein BD413DRAFT_617504 [Trametes elegans]|nr:hypothetical protein BD413DRAFT_617504 [Trametes elegans]